MGTLSVWKILEKSLANLKKEGVHVPEKVMDDLKSARAMIRASSRCFDQEANQKTEQYLTNVESFLMLESSRIWGDSYANDLMKHVAEAGRMSQEQEREEATTTFTAGVPRQAQRIRVKPFKGMPLHKLKDIAADLQLEWRVQREGILLVYGSHEKIRQFVKQIAQNTRPKPENALKS